MPRPTKVSGLGPDSPLADAARRLIGARLSDVRQYELGLRVERSIETVHDMRVGARRLRAALQLFAPGVLDAEERATKLLQDALGAVRDLHVQLDWLDARRRETVEHAGPAAGALAALVDEQRHLLPAREQALLDELARWSTYTAEPLVAHLDELSAPGTLGGKPERTLLRRLLKRVDRGVAETLASPDANTAHRLRITVKKIRYAVELLEPAAPRTMAILLAALVPLQERLGDLHDADVRLALLEDYARRAAPELRQGALETTQEVERERRNLGAELVVELEGMKAEGLIRRLARLVA